MWSNFSFCRPVNQQNYVVPPHIRSWWSIKSCASASDRDQSLIHSSNHSLIHLFIFSSRDSSIQQSIHPSIHPSISNGNFPLHVTSNQSFFWGGREGTGFDLRKHCQRQNGLSGSYTNLDQISSSESRPSIIFKISTKHQHLD